ncbi:hypothetical protein GGF32_008054 [Allomyces javanicus]|nr:hypothetical protein GGF32_008054 [Allomyces javanicus]
MIPPPPPPPLPSRRSAIGLMDVADGSDASTHAYFAKVLLDENARAFEYQIAPTPDPALRQPGEIPLFPVIKALIPGAPLSRKLAPQQLLYALGKLRGTQLTLNEYNASLSIDDDADEGKRYARHHAIDLFSVLAFQPPDATTPVTVPGLDELVASVEDHFAESLASHRAAIAAGSVEFDGLGELYKPGTLLAGTTALGGGVAAGYRVRTSWYEEKRTLFKIETSFHMRLECIVSFGRYFSLVTFDEVYSGWTGAKVRALADLGLATPVAQDDTHLHDRGAKCVDLLAGNAVPFVEYAPGSFFVHRGSSNRGGSMVPSVASGRIVIDGERGMLLGHYPSQGADEVTLAIQGAAARYKRIANDASLARGELPPVGQGILLFRAVPDNLHAVIWPALVGFSFATKAWGHVLADAVHSIRFNDDAFAKLVLAPERKRLIRALVKFGAGKAQFDDLIQGKSGGSVFLLHGPPGCGKTLTAEAIAELLHRPLYYVTMGELGTTPQEMEDRLGSVLELCAGWNALALIDEADVFLEKRTASADVTRNAMVCVMLRLLEYHPGILFLTTNRVLEFDPAFESRVTVALRYDHLAPDARAQVWRNLVGNLRGIEVDPALDFEKLAETVMNGRQIKNAVRLALALAEDMESPLTQDLIEQTIAITAVGREEMTGKNAYVM